MKAHAAIDPIWKNPPYHRRKARNAVYAKLKDMFGGEIHIGAADIALCQAIIARASEIPPPSS